MATDFWRELLKCNAILIANLYRFEMASRLISVQWCGKNRLNEPAIAALRDSLEPSFAMRYEQI